MIILKNHGYYTLYFFYNLLYKGFKKKIQNLKKI